jgi:hypothetical protein
MIEKAKSFHTEIYVSSQWIEIIKFANLPYISALFEVIEPNLM